MLKKFIRQQSRPLCKRFIQQWIKQPSPEITLTETITKPQHLGLLATIESQFDDPVNQTIHPTAHWLYFLPRDPTTSLAKDGYESDNSPPAPFTLRMYAGGEVIYHKRTPKIGETITRVTKVENKQLKKGKSGDLVFVSIKHDYKSGDDLLMTDVQNFVYRPESAKISPAPTQERLRTEFERKEIPLNEVLLFRYSALTFNGHRIHYDKDYCKHEGYEAPLVHGPLSATLLADLVHQVKPKGTRIEKFVYRAVYPMLCNSKVVFGGERVQENGYKLWAQNANSGTVHMVANAYVK